MQGKRLVWMDHMRGVAIVLVVLFHASTLLRFGYTQPKILGDLNAIFTPYRMPTLAFLSGFLAHLSFRKSTSVFVVGKLRNLLWPYLAWTVVVAVTIGQDFSLVDYRLYISYLWYLLYLLAYYLLSYFTRPVPRVPTILAALGIAAVIPAGLEAPQRFFFLLAMFQLGEFAYSKGEEWNRIIGRRSVYLLLIPVAAASVAAVQGVRVQYDPRWFAASLAGILFLTTMFPRLPDNAVMRLLAFVGRNSVVFYVVHFPVVFGTVHLVHSLGVESAYVAFVCNVAAALAVGSAACVLRTRVPQLNVLFAFPTRERSEKRHRVPVG